MRERISGFLSKFFFEILPATVASAVAGFLFGHLGIFEPSTPQAGTTPPSAEMLKMVRDDHEAFVQFLKQAHENKSDAASIQQAEARLKQEEQSAQEALRQAKEAEAKALAAARAAERGGERKVAAKAVPPARPKTPAPGEAVLGQIVVGQPMPIAPTQPAPITVPPAPAPMAAAALPPSQPAPEQHWSIGGAAHSVASSVGGWFSTVEPPRPPGTLPQANFSAASDVLAPRLGQP